MAWQHFRDVASTHPFEVLNSYLPPADKGPVATMTDLQALSRTFPSQSSTHTSGPSIAFSRFSVLLLAQSGQRRDGLARTLIAQGATDVATLESAAAAREFCATEQVRDLVVVDGGLPDAPVLPTLMGLRQSGWRRSLLLTPRSDVQAVRAAVGSGVRAYVVAHPHEDPARFDVSIARTSAASERVGLNSLSRREIEVIALVSEGMSNKDVGERLGLSALTVKSHLARIARKLGTGDRAHMVAMAMRAGLIR